MRQSSVARQSPCRGLAIYWASAITLQLCRCLGRFGKGIVRSLVLERNSALGDRTATNTHAIMWSIGKHTRIFTGATNAPVRRVFTADQSIVGIIGVGMGGTGNEDTGCYGR